MISRLLVLVFIGASSMLQAQILQWASTQSPNIKNGNLAAGPEEIYVAGWKGIYKYDYSSWSLLLTGEEAYGDLITYDQRSSSCFFRYSHPPWKNSAYTVRKLYQLNSITEELTLIDTSLTSGGVSYDGPGRMGTFLYSASNGSLFTEYRFEPSLGLALVESTDSGRSWKNVGITFPREYHETRPGTGYWSIASPKFFRETSDGGFIVATSPIARIYRKTPGSGWTGDTLGVYPAIIEVGAGNEIHAVGTDLKVYISHDTGVTFEHTQYQFPTNTTFYCSLIDKKGNLYIGTSFGVYVSQDKGYTWTLENSGLNDTIVTSLAIDSSGSLFSLTQKGEIFRSAVHTDIETKSSKCRGVYFPNNPVSGELTVTIVNDAQEPSVWTISSITGCAVKQVKTLLEAGENRIIMPCHDLSDGIYMLTITTPQEKRSCKFVVLN